MNAIVKQDVSGVITDILKHLHQSGVRKIGIRTIVELYILSEDYRFGNSSFKLLPLFRRNEQFQKASDLKDQNFADIFFFDMLTEYIKSHVDLTDELDLARKRLYDINDVISIFSGLFEDELMNNIDLEGFEFDEDTGVINVPRDVSPQLLVQKNRLTHRVEWSDKLDKAAQKARETREKKKLVQLVEIKETEVDLDDLSVELLRKLGAKAKKTSTQKLDEMLLKMSTREEALYLYAIKQEEKRLRKKEKKMNREKMMEKINREKMMERMMEKKGKVNKHGGMEKEKTGCRMMRV
jgi:hypothetical protein